MPPEERKQEEEELLPDKAGWDASAIELLSDIAESTSEKENEPENHQVSDNSGDNSLVSEESSQNHKISHPKNISRKIPPLNAKMRQTITKLPEKQMIA